MKNGKQLHLEALADAQKYSKRAAGFAQLGFEDLAAQARTTSGCARKLAEKIAEKIKATNQEGA